MVRAMGSYGVMAGLIVGVPLVGLTVTLGGHPPSAWGMAIGFATMLLAFSLIFVAIRRARAARPDGRIGFWQGLGLGLGITLVASVIYVAAWEVALAVSGLDFAATYAAAVIDQKRAAGASATELAALTVQMQQFQRDYANPLYRMAMTFTEIAPVGLLVSLVSAGLLSNPRFAPVRDRGAAG